MGRLSGICGEISDTGGSAAVYLLFRAVPDSADAENTVQKQSAFFFGRNFAGAVSGT